VGSGAALLAVVLVICVGMAARRHARVDRSTSSSTPSHPDDGPPVLWDVPAFAFAGANGQVITASDLRGHIWIADFIFTRCTTMCPIITAQMTMVRRTIRSADIRFVSFSIDPAFDTPDVLQAYAGRWSPDPRWLLLRPSPTQVNEFARGMHVPFESSTDPGEPILHTTVFFLVDRGGRVRGMYGSLDDQAVGRLVADARRLDSHVGRAVKRSEADPTGEPSPTSRTSHDRALTGTSHGLALYEALGCGGCHADPKTGPSLTGLAGQIVRLEGGATVVADDSYVRQSILDPTAKIVTGYNPLMPAYRGHLTDAEVDDLVTYLHSIGPAEGASRSPTAGEATPSGGLRAEADVDVRDPVCGMTIKRQRAGARSDYLGRTYYFCSDRCRDRFVEDPARYAR
jgi:protein SCO1/2